MVLLLATAPPAEAAFRATVTKAEGFSVASLKRIAIITVECDEVVDCANLEQRAREQASELGLPFTVVPEQQIREFLFDRGEAVYRPELRQALVEKFELSAVLEIKVPFSERGDGFGGKRRSSVRIDVELLSPEGKILLRGTGTGRPLNVVTSPERVAANVLKEILREAFE
jgi:hypothetical protein